MSPEGQKIERRIRPLWRRRHETAGLDSDLRSAARALARSPVGFHDWEILYRQLLQIEAASRGDARVIQASLAGEASPRSASARKLRRAARAR
jgi:hypothetical protein